MILPLSIALGLISMLAYGFANAYSQPLSKSLGAAQTLFLRGLTIVAILTIAALPSLMQPHSWVVMLATVALGVAGYLPVLAFTHGIKISRLGIVAPIAGTSPLITVLLAYIFLHTSIHTLQWVAIVVIIVANVAVSVDFKNWRQSNLLQRSSGIPYALIATVGWGLFYFFLVSVTTTLGPWLSALLVEIGVTVAAGVHLWLSRRPIPLRDALRTPVILNAALICTGTVAFTLGVRYFNVGIVAALSNSTALISALLGSFMFHERLTRLEKGAAAAMIVGVAIIALA
ncbi:MAG TPA: DMT family transporter [Candidatus Saccharimonadia bacterium]|nr:DMT family transporter [Candidatus Saccharimonadia bacterium]